MSNKYDRIFIILAILIHLAILAFCIKTNTFQGIGLDEARFIAAGVHNWRRGDFRPANDSPPLARMIAALPLLPLEVRLPDYDDAGRGDEAAARERELMYGARFASMGVNPQWYRLACLAKATGFLWWLLGAWVVGRWSGELYGRPSRLIALALWCVCPNILAFEQQATPDLPLAVAWAWAAYAFRRYLRSPSWEGAMGCGLLMGVAQLIDFASLTLFIAWPMLAIGRRLMRGIEASDAVRREQILQALFTLGVGVWILNVGYGFSGSGASLGSHDFSSRVLKGVPSPNRDPAANRASGNRFRGAWLGRVACPVPADYLAGLDRRLERRERPETRGDDEGWPAGVDDPLAAAGERRPVGVWAMALAGAALLLAGRRPAALASEELALWLPVGIALLTTTPAVGLLPAASGSLLATPFLIVMASSLLGPPRPRAITTIAALLASWAIADGLHTIRVDQVTPVNRARLGLDLDKYRRRLGFPAPERGDPGDGGRRLLYRTFIDSRGEAMNYALFVPRGYRGDRPHPLILFLHGYGDRGTEGRQFTAVGLPFTLTHREVDFLVLCPQGRSGTWDPGGDDARRTMELLAAVERDYRVDADRIVLTGLSSGGAGVWDLAAEHPRRWAAIVPIAGAPHHPGKAVRIKDVPCWCFHNRYDGDSPAADVRAMIAALRSAGGRPKYTEYLAVNHDAWDRAYASPELFDWLSRQRASQPK